MVARKGGRGGGEGVGYAKKRKNGERRGKGTRGEGRRKGIASIVGGQTERGGLLKTRYSADKRKSCTRD